MPQRIQRKRTEHVYAMRFGAASVRAILAGDKTQTRRIIRNWPSYWSNPILVPPHPREGEQFYISETIEILNTDLWSYKESAPAIAIQYIADTWHHIAPIPQRVKPPQEEGRWPGRTLPIEWARPWRGLVTRLWAEHLQDISDSDAKAEGFGGLDHFREIWLQLYAERGIRWMDNPMVWVRGFEAANSTEPSNV